MDGPEGTTPDDTNTPGVTLNPAAPADPEFVPVNPVVRRLTRDEYVYTVADVLGVTLNDEDRAKLPVDRPLDGFVNTATGQSVLPDHVLAYSELAATIVSALDLEAWVDEHAPCVDSEDSCHRGFVESAGRLVFRRPLTEEETEGLVRLFDAVAADSATFEEGAGFVVEAMLQSPAFLYLLEVETDPTFRGLREINGFEMASRLSYLLWASAPDQALYDAAQNGELDSAAGILTQVDRMLRDEEKTARIHERFLLDWARLESLPDDDGLRDELVEAATAFYLDLATSNGSLLTALHSSSVFLTPALADAYGIPGQGAGVRAYDVSSVADRSGGLLTQPGVIAGMTNADGGAIVARGLFLQQQLFCRDVPDPPDSLQDAIDAFVDELEPNASDREIAEARLERPECAACHTHFDPLAYALEQFDSRGRFRTEDEHGNPLRTDGFIPASLTETGQAVPYQNLDDYLSSLAPEAAVQACLVQRQLEYALRSRLLPEHQASVRELTTTVALAPNQSVEDLLRLVVGHDLFRTMPIE